ncbi:MAG: two-component system, chemotaxis family, protein-glutamate methylesterase/glutaminase [Sphingomonadales bacterium]|nr:two-component system, chemotaxis family, protein-glutamate methylesterase/glutaminase [Sphingomonadales bacterium]
MTRPAARAAGDKASAPPPLQPMPALKLMIVDDSQVARAVLSRMLAAFPDFEIVATAADAGEALRLLPTIAVDIVLLDVEMPGESGLEALPEIVRLGRGARVLIVSSFCGGDADAAVSALAPGAAETLSKPGAEAFSGRFSDILAERLRRMGRRGSPASAAPAERSEGKLGCLAVGASTGGLNAVTALLSAFPARIGAPILITQHLPSAFLPFFARQVEAASGRTTRIAEDGLELKADEILLAPGDAHIGLEQRGARVRVKLDRTPAKGGCLPSVDVMLEAVAATYGGAALGVVLSGMGRDGLAGSRELVARGGTVMAQDRPSCAVWGMPRVVVEAGLASAVLAPAGLAAEIAARVESTSCR